MILGRDAEFGFKFGSLEVELGRRRGDEAEAWAWLGRSIAVSNQVEPRLVPSEWCQHPGLFRGNTRNGMRNSPRSDGSLHHLWS
jgi:hypothetical protein